MTSPELATPFTSHELAEGLRGRPEAATILLDALLILDLSAGKVGQEIARAILRGGRPMRPPRPIPAASLPASLGPWTWKYADGRVWASRRGINIWAAPDCAVKLEIPDPVAVARSIGARLEPVVLGATGTIAGEEGECVVLNGGVYDWDLISVARIQWPEAAWYAPPGMVARRVMGDGFAAAGAVARVGGIVVAAVGAITALPEEVL